MSICVALFGSTSAQKGCDGAVGRQYWRNNWPTNKSQTKPKQAPSHDHCSSVLWRRPSSKCGAVARRLEEAPEEKRSSSSSSKLMIYYGYLLSRKSTRPLRAAAIEPSKQVVAPRKGSINDNDNNDPKRLRLKQAASEGSRRSTRAKARPAAAAEAAEASPAAPERSITRWRASSGVRSGHRLGLGLGSGRRRRRKRKRELSYCALDDRRENN